MLKDLSGAIIRLPFDGGVLRTLLPDDVHSSYIDGLNDPEVNHYLVGVSQETQTKSTVSQFIECNLTAPDGILFGVWKGQGECHCGTVRLHGIEGVHMTAHIGVCLFDRGAWGAGLGSKGISAVTQWALNNLGLRWVEAGIYEENVASQKAFLRVGYEWKFDIPGKYLLHGEPASVKIYAMQAKSLIA